MLAIVSFVLAAPLLFSGLASTYFLFSNNWEIAGSLGMDEWMLALPYLAILGAVLFGGIAFLTAGVAILATKPRAKQVFPAVSLAIAITGEETLRYSRRK